MKKFILFSLVLCLLTTFGYAQQKPQSTPFLLGKCTGLFGDKLKSAPGNVQKLNLAVSGTQTFVAKITYSGTTESGKQELAGELDGIPSSAFFVKYSSNSVEGNIILKSTREDYKYYSDDQGNAYVVKTDINGVICIDYNKPNSNLKSAVAPTKATTTVSASTLNMQSYPGANGCVLLDFDGQYVVNAHWNNGNPIDAQAFAVTDDNIQEAWEMISEDYRPFNINITTSEAVYNTYPKNRRMRCIFTPTNTAAPGAGGVAYVGCFNWGDETPCWSFMAGGKAGGEAASHEIGHTLGLGHDGRTSPVEEYYAGQGNWAPIMGVGYYKPITQWSKGEYAYANNVQDDMAIISGANYGLGYRADDHGNTFATAAPLIIDGLGNISASQNYGVIENAADIDVFSFSTGGGNVVLNFSTIIRHSDLDIFVTLFNSAGTVIATYDPSGLPSTINTSVTQGTYYVSVRGTGAGNPATDGYSNYASIGSYYISGTVPPDISVLDLALNKPAVASSVETSDFPASYAFDGSMANRWSSLYSDPQWIYVDLGAAYNINRVKLSWEAAYASAYEIQVSSDATNWTSIYSTTTGTGGTNDLAITGTGRYVRMYGTQRATAWGYSLWEFEVYGTPSLPVTVFQHCNYLTSGYAVGLEAGNYTIAQLMAKGIPNNDISSLKISSGYEVVLYKNDNFTGEADVFSSDIACLYSLGLNDSTSSLRVRSTSNQLPSVSFASPTSGTILNGPTNVVLTVNASDADGNISKVEFFNSSVKLGEATSAPYSFTWTNVALGSYIITAIVTDDRGGQASVQISLQIIAPVAASVYQDCNYGGYAVDLAPGSYTLTQLIAKGIKNDDISSIKVKSGYEAILYQDDNFGGDAYAFQGDFSCLVSLYANNVAINLNDWTSSIVVQTSTAAAAAQGTDGNVLTTKSIVTQGEIGTNTVVISPNPFIDYVTIRMENAKEDYLTIVILNANGNVVIPSQKFKNGSDLHLNGLSAGLYFIKIQTEEGSVTKKILKLQ